MIFDQLDLFGIKARQRRAERAEDRAEREREREKEREERRAERADNLEAAERAERAAERRHQEFLAAHRELLAALTGRDITGDGEPDDAAPGPEAERNH